MPGKYGRYYCECFPGYMDVSVGDAFGIDCEDEDKCEEDPCSIKLIMPFVLIQKVTLIAAVQTDTMAMALTATISMNV